MGCTSSNTSINKNLSSFFKDEMKSVLTYTTQKDSITAEVSSVSVGCYLDHISLTINQVYSVLEKSNSKDFCESLNTGKSMLFAFDEMPRGQAKAPKNVRPPKHITIEKINLDYELAKANILQMDSLPNNAYFTHPYFGALKKDEAKQFLEIHTNHHIGIINDIISTKAK